MRRRSFLKMGLFGSSLLALGGLGLALQPSDRKYAPRRPLRAFQVARFPVLASVAARVITVPGADPVEIAHRADDAIVLAPPEAAEDLNKFLGLLESGLVGLLLDGRPQPFTRLGPEAQDAALRAFRDSRLVVRRAGYQALRKLCAAVHYSQESCWADVGYPGPPQLLMPSDSIMPVVASPAAATAGKP